MKHYFIINPNAGAKDMTSFIFSELEKLTTKIDYEVFVTTAPQDAYHFTKNICQNASEEIRFYACGGDGTLNEVLNGSFGFTNASITCVPVGSGNDYIKNFNRPDDFIKIEKLIAGKEVMVDAMLVNDRYTINICNFGFDAFVVENMLKFKNKAFIRGKMAYNFAVFYSLLYKMKHNCQIYLDDELTYDGNILLTAIANGKCYGGGYYCAPTARVDDGLLEACIVKSVSRRRFISLIKYYKSGEHVKHPKVMPYIIYQAAKKVDIIAEKPILYCMDGELEHANKISITNINKAVRFVIPC